MAKKKDIERTLNFAEADIKDGETIRLFRDYDEMAEKAKYYLKHDRERLQIALNGHRRVREKYSYDLQVKRILEEVSQDLIKRGKKGLV